MKSAMSGVAQMVVVACMASGAFRASALSVTKVKASTSSGGLLWLTDGASQGNTALSATELSRSALNSSLSESMGNGANSLTDLSFLHLVPEHANGLSALEMSAGVTAGVGELPSTPLDAAVIAMMRKGTPAFEGFLPDCLEHTKRIAHAFDEASLESQTVPTLEQECIGEKPFSITPSNDYDQHAACHDFATHLVAARQEELRTGDQKGYQAFCAYFYGLKYFGAKEVQLKPSEKQSLLVLTMLVVSGLIAIAVLAALQRQATEKRYASSPSDELARGRRSRTPEQPKHCRWLVCSDEDAGERPEEA